MAKVLVDIPKIEDFYYFKQTNICSANMCRAIKNGIVLDELANGEVMQTMFPQMNIISASPFSVYIEMKECNQFNNLVSFDVDWWNRKRGE